MGPGLGRAIVAAAVILTVSATVAAAEAAPDHAAFEYLLGANYHGPIEGRCDAVAVVGPSQAGVYGLAPAASAELQIIEVWRNYTLLASETGEGIVYPMDAGTSGESVALDGDAISLQWPMGSPPVFAPRAREDMDGLPVEFESDAMQVGPAGPPSQMGMDLPWVGARAEDPRRTWDLARRVEPDAGTFSVSGDWSFYLEQATILDGDERYTLAPPYERSEQQAPGVTIVSEIYRYAWLHVRGTALAASADGAIFHCRALEARVEGAMTAFAASGEANVAGTEHSFVDRQLTLVGEFVLLENLVEPTGESSMATSRASADGRFTVVGLDFAPAGGQSSDWTAAATLTLGGLAVLGLGAFILYSRIAEDRVLERPERRRLYEAIVANPGVEFSKLLDENPMSPTNARYHLKLLERRGLVRVVRVQGRHRFVPAGWDANSTRRSVLLSEDPKLRGLLRLLGSDGKPASQLVEALRAEWGLSRTGGWKVLERAVSAQLVERLVEGRRVILRRVG